MVFTSIDRQTGGRDIHRPGLCKGQSALFKFNASAFVAIALWALMPQPSLTIIDASKPSFASQPGDWKQAVAATHCFAEQG